MKTSRTGRNFSDRFRKLSFQSLEDRSLLAANILGGAELLVQFQNGASADAKAAALSSIGGTIKQEIQTSAMKSLGYAPLEVVELPPGLAVADALAKISILPTVSKAEQNWFFSTNTLSNDPYYTGGSMWGMYGDATSPANSFGSQAGEAWAGGNTGSNSVFVGIIDEGFDLNHPELAANVWTNPWETPSDGIDNDGNGYIDDIHGWDFFNKDNTIFDGAADDHGTHVAGTIGATGGNNQGVAGVNWNVTMIAAKFLGPSGGYLSDAILAIDYITDLKIRHGMNIVATNNSWGGGGYSQAMFDAIERANQASILFVAAAGNGGADGRGDNNDSTPSYPASYTNNNVISVAALQSSGALASFSNYGVTSVDLAAPGVGIISTLPGNTYGSYSGTSMATPHVTGAAALFAANHPGATAADIKSAILGSTVATSSLQGKTVTGGRLDLSKFASTDPWLVIDSVSKAEGNSGTSQMVFTVRLLGAVASTPLYSVNYATQDGTALAGSDYVSKTGILSLSGSATKGTISITINGDTTVESNEIFSVKLTSAIGNVSGTGTISNDDSTSGKKGRSTTRGNANSTTENLVNDLAVLWFLSSTDSLGKWK